MKHSTWKPDALVWEEMGSDGVVRLKFVKPEVTPEMRTMIDAAIRATPLSPDEWRLYRMTIPDSHYTWSGKATMFLSPNHHLQQPFIDPTPREWRHVSIEDACDAFNLVSMGSRMPFLPGARKFYGVEDSLVTTGLTLDQAITNGRRLEALIKLKQ